jgi:hypothetical protein
MCSVPFSVAVGGAFTEQGRLDNFRPYSYLAMSFRDIAGDAFVTTVVPEAGTLVFTLPAVCCFATARLG